MRKFRLCVTERYEKFKEQNMFFVYDKNTLAYKQHFPMKLFN